MRLQQSSKNSHGTDNAEHDIEGLKDQSTAQTEVRRRNIGNGDVHHDADVVELQKVACNII